MILRNADLRCDARDTMKDIVRTICTRPAGQTKLTLGA